MYTCRHSLAHVSSSTHFSALRIKYLHTPTHWASYIWLQSKMHISDGRCLILKVPGTMFDTSWTSLGQKLFLSLDFFSNVTSLFKCDVRAFQLYNSLQYWCAFSIFVGNSANLGFAAQLVQLTDDFFVGSILSTFLNEHIVGAEPHCCPLLWFWGTERFTPVYFCFWEHFWRLLKVIWPQYSARVHGFGFDGRNIIHVWCILQIYFCFFHCSFKK